MSIKRKISKPNIGKGDFGFTDFIGSAIAHKSSWQAQACGSVDELNALVGQAIAHQKNSNLIKDLTDICNDLFLVGADIASSMMSAKKTDKIAPTHVHHLEDLIAKYEEHLPVIHNFILPLGLLTTTSLHHARTVCRRTEQQMVTHMISLSKKEYLNPLVLAYLNRLSDVFFAMARFTLKESNTPEIYWKDPSK